MSHRKRRLRLLLVVAVFLAAATVFWVGGAFVRCMAEQLPWMLHSDASRLEVEGVQYSSQGIALDVFAPAGVAEVWKQHTKLSPFKRQHYRSSFRIMEHTDSSKLIVLVDYEFQSDREWLLALKSKDGYWRSISPYFPKEPHIRDADWDGFVKRSKQTVVE